jgi:hypothetical protein
MLEHASTSHNHETAPNLESTAEKLFESIAKIISTIRSSINKVYAGFKNILANLATTLSNKIVNEKRQSTLTSPPPKATSENHAIPIIKTPPTAKKTENTVDHNQHNH